MMTTLSTLGLASALSCALWLSACGSSPPPPAPPVAPNPPPPAEGAVAEPAGLDEMEEGPAEPAEADKLVWGKMSHEQKLEHMKTKVMPEMSALFQAFDAKEFKGMNCMSCHGPGAKDGKFAMPNAALPKLTTDGKFAAEMKAHPNETKFMMQKVVPTMAPLLDAKPYDPATQKGFGCFGCHTAKK